MTPEQDKLVQDHLHVAQKVAGKQAARYKTSFDELYSVTLESLCNSAKKWDTNKDRYSSFEFFAVNNMFNAIYDDFRKRSYWSKEDKRFVIDNDFQIPSNDSYEVELSESLKKHLDSMSIRDRQILLDFANGGIKYAAKNAGLTEARCSQIRTKAHVKWLKQNRD